jgi:asparagine synthase (glutamine-hydrolysing)
MFEAVAQRVRALNLTFLAEDKLASIGRCLSSVKKHNVAGNFLEFGVALGGSAICIASQLDEDREFFGLDVFGMSPPPTARDGVASLARYDTIRSGAAEGIGGETYYGYVDDLKHVVAANLAAFGLSPDGRRIRLVEGLYQDTIPTLPDMRIAFCHIDCDWFDPVLLCLEYAVPRLSPGGFIVIDDYHDWPGAREATDAFCAAHPDVMITRSRPHAVLTTTPAWLAPTPLRQPVQWFLRHAAR